MHLFHVAERSRWEAAQLAGAYAQSTLGRSLADEGFIHAARADQVTDVLGRHYADHPGPLVLLTIDTDRLTSPWREEPVGGTTYPHIHGPLNLDAVVGERALPGPGPRPDRSFMQVFLAEMTFRMIAAVVVMTISAGCGFAAALLVGDRAGVLGILAGALLGLALVLPVARRRRARLDAGPSGVSGRAPRPRPHSPS